MSHKEPVCFMGQSKLREMDKPVFLAGVTKVEGETGSIDNESELRLLGELNKV